MFEGSIPQVATPITPSQDSQPEKSIQHLPQVPGRGVYDEEARQKRIAFIQEQTRSDLSQTGLTHLDPTRLMGNIENLIGSVEIPVGVAGPLLFKGTSVTGPIYLPLATTEGALVASATRGARAISRCGGVITHVIHQRMVRAPVFEFNSLSESARFVGWLAEHEAQIREEASKGSRHARLISIEPSLFGPMVHIEFTFETGDAAGQNMTTMCTWQACQWIQNELAKLPGLHLRQFLIEGNLTGDKKLTFRSFIKGRGTRVTAEAFIDNDTFRHILKVEPERIVKGIRLAMAGGFESGQVGFNINVSNVVAAAFTACGQDIACVLESSLASLDVREEKDGLRLSLLMPTLVVGTVGGGTHLPRQKELLSMMGCTGRGSSARLAEIIAGFCLSLDLSTMSAIASDHFAAAHDKLGRNKQVQGLGLTDLNPDFFQGIMRDTLEDPTVQVQEIEPCLDFKMGHSIITAVAAQNLGKKLIGLFPLKLTCSRENGPTEQLEVIAKCKPTDQEIIHISTSVARICGTDVGEQFKRFKDSVGFTSCHVRELAIYRQKDPRFTRHVPKVYGIHEDPSREAYVVMMEKLKDMILMDSAGDPRGWGQEHIEAVLSGIAQIHAMWYGREAELRAQPWLGPVTTAAKMQEMAPLWKALSEHAAHEFPEWYDTRYQRWNREILESLPRWWGELEDLPRTLIHNDFNPRNVALRQTEQGLIACIYDWELATLQVPQHDLAEFLAFVLTNDTAPRMIDHYVEFHRQALEQATGQSISRDQWHLGYLLSLKDLAVNRQSLYFMAHSLSECNFFPRLSFTLRYLHDMAQAKTQVGEQSSTSSRSSRVGQSLYDKTY